MPEKKTKICFCVRFLLFQMGTWLDWFELVQHCTTHTHSSLLAWKLLTGQTFLWPHLSEVYRVLQICSKSPPSINLLGEGTRIHTGLFQNFLTRPQLSCIFLLLIILPVHNLVYFYIWFSISGIYDTSCHSQSSPFFALLYMAYILVALLAFGLWMVGTVGFVSLAHLLTLIVVTNWNLLVSNFH